MKKKLTFKQGLLIYTCILLAIMVFMLLGLRKILVEYEKSQSYNTVEAFCKNLENDLAFNSLANEEKYIDNTKFSRFEDEKDIRSQYIKFFSGKKTEYTLSSTSFDANRPVFIIHNGSEVFGELKLKLVSEKTKLSMLSIAEWEIDSFVPEIASLGVAYAITIPQEYSVTVNGSKLGEDDIASQKNGEILYLASGLTKEPEIVITNAKGETVEHKVTLSEENKKLYQVETEYTLFSFTIPTDFKVETALTFRKNVKDALTSYSMVVEKLPTAAELNELVTITDFTGDQMKFTDNQDTGVPAPTYYAYELTCPDISKVTVAGISISLEEGEKIAIAEKQYSSVKQLVKVGFYTANSVLADAADINSKARISITDAENNVIDYKVENGAISTVVSDITITIPNNFQIAQNGKKLEFTPVEGKLREYEELLAYTTVPTALTYTIPKQYAPVKVEITNNLGNTESIYAFGNVEYVEQAGRPVIYEEGYPAAYKAIADAVDPIYYGKQWSYFMTTDLEGELKGYYTIRKYIVDGSYLDKNAKLWATGYESGLIGKHIFDNPPFKEVWYKNVVMLSDTAFYCDVHFIKSFTVTSNNTHRDDYFYHRLYFVYVDDDKDGVYSWQIAAMKEIIE